MDAYNKPGRSPSSTTSSGHRSSSNEEDVSDLRRGPWMVDEDVTLINHIANHGEGRWNSLARNAGLKRTGKSCRLRWLNYLRPDVRRGNITLEEQLLILELHSRWGNRWSKIAQHLPGRTDNEIKNYWRTRVQKHAKQLKCDVNSRQFKDTMKYLWMPRLMERIQASAAAGNLSLATANSSPEGSTITAATAAYQPEHQVPGFHMHGGYTVIDPENSCTTASSSEYSNPFYSAHDASLLDSNPSNDYYPVPSAAAGHGHGFNQQGQMGNFLGGQMIGATGYHQHVNIGAGSQEMDQTHHQQDKDEEMQEWMGGNGDQSSDNFWNNIGEDVNYWYLHNSDFHP
ncbi:hypothetical protein MLD38_038764 [Melastoma candidum]|uniref:Uncharacterized protein n=1 Tax=Melastoma candidum TaxID=119954 RepID=A0ACB9L0M1_9MYRT|nr:hypothetical protein MLD38_038764 [Melastoma candidum]